MIVIIEGLDNTGKSTLIKQIRNEILTDPQTTSIHCSSTPKGVNQDWPLTHYTRLLWQVQNMHFNCWNVILDRSHLGEHVYGPIYRGVTNTDYVFDLERRYLYDDEVYLILLTDDIQNLVERDDGQSLSVSITDLNKVSERFLDAFKRSTIRNKLHYNLSSDGGFENLLPTVKEFLNVKD